MVAGPGSWAPTRGKLNQAREHHTATEVTYTDGGTSRTVVVVAGGVVNKRPGTDAEKALNSIEIYDPKSKTFSVANPMNIARSRHTATWLPNRGKLLVVGGQDDNNKAISLCELYDPATNVWSISGSLSLGRWHHTATLCRIGGESVMVVGGYTTSPGLQVAGTSEFFGPIGPDEWVPLRLNTPRAFHGAAMTRDKNNNDIILIAGGCSSPDGPALKSFETLNIDSIVGWKQPSAQMNLARKYFDCIGMRNGTPTGDAVLAAGGLDENDKFLNSAEWYNNATQSWRTIKGKMPVACAGSTTARIGGTGLWLISGGSTPNPQQAISMLCDASASSFPPTASIGRILTKSAATSLSDGTVLVTGGYPGTGYIPTNEASIFTPSS